MHDAFATWDTGESLEAIEARIHDGVSNDKLRERGRGYVTHMFKLFPWVRPSADAAIVEVGPGVGYIMEALAKETGAVRITGLDVAPNMVARARERIKRDCLPEGRFEFALYDGVTLPWADGSVDFFYSVAAIQHIPKPHAYNLFLEMHRCLKPTGSSVVHLLSWDILPQMHLSFADEIRHQVTGTPTHWHHFYDRVELETVLGHGVKAADFQVVPDGGAIWCAWGKQRRR
jgi:ubiquinone/menaquinone biosynthesis C-methylase UbiE